MYPRSARCDNEREATQSRKTDGAHCQTPHVPPGRRVFGFLRKDVRLQIVVWNEDLTASGTYNSGAICCIVRRSVSGAKVSC